MWKERYEKSLEEVDLITKIYGITASMWDLIMKDMPQLKNKLEFHLKFDELHRQMRQYLDETWEEAINRDHIVE
jgi:hypothetical protein